MAEFFDMSGHNILHSKCDALVNTVNTVGVMGKGLALAFKKEFPKYFLDYKKACFPGGKTQPLKIGTLHVWDFTDEEGDQRCIISFPTKEHWVNPSKPEWISQGLSALVQVISERGIQSIAIPKLGCSNGGLDYKDVKPRIIKYMSLLDSIQVELY